MIGSMQKHPLLIRDFLAFAAREHPEREVVTLTATAKRRMTYREAEARARRMSSALDRHGIAQGERVATLAVNTDQHFVIAYAVSCMGAVYHAINPRLFSAQLAYIINHAGDRLLFLDPAFLPLVEEIADEIRGTVRTIVLLETVAPAAKAALGTRFEVLDHDDLLATGQPDYTWPDLDEDLPASLCFTSGTTGDPKGVLYSHRSTVIHAYGANTKDGFNLGANDVVLPLVPMFHTNCWGFIYMAPMVGANLILSAVSLMDGASVTRLMQEEGVTFACGVPTIWASLLRYLDETGEKVPTVERLQSGGAACPLPIMERFWHDHGVNVVHGWGMTELSPIGVINRDKAGTRALPITERLAHQRKAGRGICGVEMKLIDETGADIPRDGETSGRLVVRGHWVVDTYFGAPASALVDGWFDTGDIATIDGDGYMEIVDRSKDVIKSGGEWISSIALEHIAMGVPGIEEAAAIPVPHARWDERPLLLAVRAPGATVSRDDVLRAYDGVVARWWVPDDVVFVSALPHSNTGKVVKTELRETYRNHFLQRADH